LVPTMLLAAVTATSRVRSLSRSPYWLGGSSAVDTSTSAQRTTASRRAAARTPRRTVASWAGLGNTTPAPGPPPPAPRPPLPGQGFRQPVGKRGHVRAEDHAVRFGAGQVGQGPAAFGQDGVGASAGREGAPGVADPGPVGIRDRLDYRRGNLRARGAVQVGIAIGQGRVGRPYAVYVKAH